MPSCEDFLEEFFKAKDAKHVIQIGANDGVQNDPLRPYLKKPGNYEAILVEPIPFYIQKLRDLYKDRSDIKIVHAAIGSKSDTADLYYIEPEVAEEMNGDGPFNNWAHGQGSFNYETVVHWINENAFRGKEYRDSIPRFIKAITKINTSIVSTETLLPAERKNLLLVVDVQGFELEVLGGIDWNNPPKWIMLEDDLGNTGTLVQYMQERNFSWVAGDHDKVFKWHKSISS